MGICGNSGCDDDDMIDTLSFKHLKGARVWDTVAQERGIAAHQK